MEQVEVFKALSNKARLQILMWLRDPEKYFPAEGCGPYGVCVGQIQSKMGVTQSTASEYLSLLQRTGLLTATRQGQWTYYKRNEDAIQQLGELILKDL
jgi:DNA-binding transcriptional ArsR family regulator